MSFRNALTLSLAAGILATVSIIPACAGTFAQFNQQTGNNAFALTGAVSPGQVLSTTSTPVFFNFLSAAGNPLFTAPVPLGMDISAVLTLTATSSTPVIPGPTPQESFNNVSFSFTTTANQTVNGFFIPAGTNLLTGSSFAAPVPISATLAGVSGANSATFSGGDTGVPPALTNTVTFSSAYINFTGATNKAYAYSFSSVFMNFSASPTGLNPFTAAGTGTFSANNGVPEPGAVAMLAGLGVTGSLFAFRRLGRRK
jgi:hypothetical protein